MEILKTIADVRAWTDDRLQDGGTIGFVPTMGYLHAGHVSLVDRAKRENRWVVASVFVNPTQFGPKEDFASYPRDLARDAAMLEAAGCDMVFAPEPEEMYPAGAQTWVDVGDVGVPLEGAVRPGHFRGVATVVMKLFGIVTPTRAYFGQKDAQQLAVITAMVRDLNVPVQVVGCPTVREADGLAMSSRNSYLSSTERAAATVLYRSLTAARDAWCEGDREAESLRRRMQAVLAEEPLAETQYVSVSDPVSLRELAAEVPAGALLSMAVRIGKTRLIDNIVLKDGTGCTERS